MSEIQRGFCVCRTFLAVVVSVAASTWYPVSAKADLVFNLSEVGSDVVLTVEGILDTSGLSPAGPFLTQLPAFNSGELQKSGGFSVGSPGLAGAYQVAGTGPNFLDAPLGSSPVADVFDASSATGDIVGLSFGQDADVDAFGFILPDGYVSGSALSGTATFGGESLASMNLAVADYAWISGPNTISLSISAVPEPFACVPLAALSAVWFLRRRRMA